MRGVSRSRVRLVFVLVGVVAILAGAAALVRCRALRALSLAAGQEQSERDLRFEVRRLSVPRASPFESISVPADFTDATLFQSHLFISGPTGISEYDGRGNLVVRYLVGRDLPSAPLGRIVTGLLSDSTGPELLISTAGEGVLAFDGQSYRQIRPESEHASDTTTLLPLVGGQLLIGTRKRGVLIYDGTRLRPLHDTLRDVYVTALAGSAADLWVGTLRSGVLHFVGGRTEAFGESEGMPDPHVLDIAVEVNDAFVGTPVGVAHFHDGRLQRVLAKGIFAQAIKVNGRTLLAGTMDEGIREVSLSTARVPVHAMPQTRIRTAVTRFFDADDTTYAVTGNAVFALRSSGWQHVLDSGESALSDRNVSALAVDSHGRLWVGYFDRGLDLIEPGGRRVDHFEDETVFCVNRILSRGVEHGVAVATANGLVLFDSAANKQQVLRRSDGLIADHITDISPYGDGWVIATPAGITFLDLQGARSLYAFHGLINNHVYAIGASGNRVLAGTLGGISFLDSENVTQSYSTSNSALTHNWTTALAQAGSEWFLGTYGGGVARVDASGRITMFSETRDQEINPGAMLVTERHVIAGSLRSGMLVYNRSDGRWKSIASGLPSRNVTALAAANGTIYVGTDNGLVKIAEQSLD